MFYKVYVDVNTNRWRVWDARTRECSYDYTATMVQEWYELLTRHGRSETERQNTRHCMGFKRRAT